MNKNSLNKRIDALGKDAIFFGDWHGDLVYALNSIERAREQYPEIKVYYHVGDFGVWPKGEMYLKSVASALFNHGCIMLVTGGNHEDWDQWDAWMQVTKGTPYEYDRTGLIFLPKKFEWKHGDVRYLSVGGASSIDRSMRIPGVSWWEQEEIQPETVESIIKDESSKGVDVLITHEASNNPVLPIKHRLNNVIQQAQWRHDDKVASEEQRMLVSRVLEHVRPKKHVHGHWHMPYREEIDGVDTVSLGDNRTSYAENSHVLRAEKLEKKIGTK